MAKLLDLPPLGAGVVVLFAAMPTGANAYIFAVQYQRLVDPVSGAIALATLLAAVTLRATLRIWGVWLRDLSALCCGFGADLQAARGRVGLLD